MGHSSEKLGAILSKHRSNQVTTHILPSLLGTISRKIPHRSVSLAILLGVNQQTHTDDGLLADLEKICCLRHTDFLKKGCFVSIIVLYYIVVVILKPETVGQMVSIIT